MKPSEDCLRVIALCEGKFIYVGGLPVRKVESMDEAIASLEQDLVFICEQIQRLFKVRVKQHQFDAVMMAAHSLSVDTVRHSGICKLINKGQIQQAADCFLTMNKKAKEIPPVFAEKHESRRMIERNIFLHGEYPNFDQNPVESNPDESNPDESNPDESKPGELELDESLELETFEELESFKFVPGLLSP